VGSIGGGDHGHGGDGHDGGNNGPPGFSHPVLLTAAANQIVTGHNGDTIIGAYHDTITGGTNDVIWMASADTVYAAAGDTIIGGKTTGFDSILANGGNETVTGTPTNETATGFDTVTGPGHDQISFSGESQRSIANVVATQEQSGGNTTLHLPDGSSITLVGVTHVTSSFFH
jgi:hypothetical protein